MRKTSIPYVSVKPTYSTVYSVPEDGKKQPSGSNSALNVWQPAPEGKTAVAKNNNTSWTLSVKSRKKLVNSINWLTLYSQKKKVFHADKKHSFNFKINFITLTLPVMQRHLDSTIKSKILNGFLTELRDRYKVRNYVWRAECQSNGSLHFHLVTDSFINAFLLRRLWNRKLELLGYITAYHNKYSGLNFAEYCNMLNAKDMRTKEQLLQSYEYGRKTNWRNPNTTDVHSVQKIRNLAAYISKYMAKKSKKHEKQGRRSIQNRRISGRLWGCSTSISRVKSCVEFYSGRMETALNKAIDSGRYKVIRERFFMCVFVPIKELIAINKKLLSDYLVNYAREIGYSPVKAPPKGYYFDKSLYYEIPS